jgi:hypothetical protein
MEKEMGEAYAALMLQPAMYMDRAKYIELSEQWTTEMPKKSRVTRVTVKDFNLTMWGGWLLDETLRTPKSHLWKEFRGKFRMPPDLFLDHFVPEAKRYVLILLLYTLYYIIYTHYIYTIHTIYILYIPYTIYLTPLPPFLV